jgi:disulfide bond formation protein DsbB
MVLTTRPFAGAVLAASIVVLGTALLSQYWGGLLPCELCLLQRWPWWIAIGIAAAAWLIGNRLALAIPALLLAIVFLTGAGIAFYHVGVEQHWFAGPTACTVSVGGNATTIEELRRQLEATPPVMCDQIQWSLFGISLAGWNLLASLLLAAFCSWAAMRATSPRRAAA